MFCTETEKQPNNKPDSKTHLCVYPALHGYTPGECLVPSG